LLIFFQFQLTANKEFPLFRKYCHAPLVNSNWFLLELILAEGAGLRGGYSTPETLSNRDRCRCILKIYISQPTV